MTDAELDRIRAAYTERDAATDSPYRWDNPPYVAFMQQVERALLRSFADAGVTLAGMRVLEVGCGRGYYLHRLSEYGAGECHGVDLMESRIAAGRERYPSLHLRVGNAADLPYAVGEFDLVTQFTCLSSIVDPHVRLSAAHEMQRVARGGLVLSFDMRGILPARFRRMRSGETPTIVALDEQELRRLFGAPALLRRAALAFELAQLTGGRTILTGALGALPPLRSHLLGIWRVAPTP
jgi:SAM-dependent methyltransferase